MSWFIAYRLLWKYKGDMTKATKNEIACIEYDPVGKAVAEKKFKAEFKCKNCDIFDAVNSRCELTGQVKVGNWNACEFFRNYK